VKPALDQPDGPLEGSDMMSLQLEEHRTQNWAENILNKHSLSLLSSITVPDSFLTLNLSSERREEKNEYGSLNKNFLRK